MSSRHSRCLLVALVGLVLPTLVSCGHDSPAEPSPTQATSLSIWGKAPAVHKTSVFTAEAKCADYIVRYVTNQAEWSSSNPSVLTVGPGGNATGISRGTARVTASYQGVSTWIEVYVVDSVETVSIVGWVPRVGEQARFHAWVRWSDWTTSEAKYGVTWWSTNPAVAVVDQEGLLKAVGVGETDLTASYQDVTGRIHLKIGRRWVGSRLSLQGIAPKVGAASLFTALETFDNGTIEDVTGRAYWRSEDTKIATVRQGGVVTGVAPGEVYIRAEDMGHMARMRIRIDR